MSAIASCGLCPWQVEFATPAAAVKGRDRHERLRHPSDALTARQDIPEDERRIPQLASADWRLQALEALRRLARERAEFTVYDVADFGVGQPLRPQFDWGKLTRDAAHLGLIRHALDADGREKSTRSKRPGTKSSPGRGLDGRPRGREAVRMTQRTRALRASWVPNDGFVTESKSTAVCKHGESEPHHFAADDYPCPGLWRCDGPDQPAATNDERTTP